MPKRTFPCGNDERAIGHNNEEELLFEGYILSLLWDPLCWNFHKDSLCQEEDTDLKVLEPCMAVGRLVYHQTFDSFDQQKNGCKLWIAYHTRVSRHTDTAADSSHDILLIHWCTVLHVWTANKSNTILHNKDSLFSAPNSTL